jgi:serine/threonine-protein kinase
MSFWSRIFSKRDPEPVKVPAPEPLPPEPKLPDDVVRLSRIGDPDGPDEKEALALFRHLRTTPDEGIAIQELIARAQQTALPESLRIAVASALADRGDSDAALRVLGECTTAAALLLRADLEADRGEIATALALAERVLLRELDHPGARERHARWRASLGLVTPSRAPAATTTVVTAEPDTPYRLLREVARGGAGAVYEAEDRDLGRRVALKVYHDPARDRAQLMHEARVAVALSGPGVVRVFDVDPDHGWIALEFASLGAIKDHVRARNHELLANVEAWALPIAAALSRVHDAGWVHLDVKPANVLLIEKNHPVLADFGIARKIGERSPPGSMGYVSPERLSGRTADPRDDVYGFGRVLEDVLDALSEPAIEARLRPIARACTGPDASRPAHAREIVMRLRAITSTDR